MLTNANYNDWSLLMKIKLEARCLWNAIDLGDVEIHVNQMTLDAVYSAIPPKMVGSIAATSTGNNEHARYMRDLRAVARRDISEDGF